MTPPAASPIPPDLIRRPAVFLDRDDTLIANSDLPAAAYRGTPGDLMDPEHVRLLPGSLGGCMLLAGAGFALVMITNQGGVARGNGSIADVERTNDAVRALLIDDLDQPLITACYAAVHHPRGRVPHLAQEHEWRKPGPGMLHAAARELGLDLERSWMIGDAERDRDAGIAAGLTPDRCLLVGEHRSLQDLAAAAEHILAVVHPYEGPSSVVTLRAAEGRPLADADARRNVEAAARSIAERTGVRLLELVSREDAISARLAAGRVAAMGFANELRRATNQWHQTHRGWPLWPERGQSKDGD